MELTKNSTNKELLATFGESKLFDGRTRIFAITSTKNENQQHLFVSQAFKGDGNITEAQKFLLGWNNSRLLRAHHGVTSEIANAFSIGDTIPFDILIEEKIVPQYEGQPFKRYPETHPSSGEAMLHNNMNIYEHSSLVSIGQGNIIKLQSITEEPNVLNNTDTKVNIEKEVNA